LARINGGVPDGTEADTSLIKIPDTALVFFASPRSGSPDFAKPREPSEISKQFRKRADAFGFPKFRLHDLRGSYETALLESSVPVHVVASRCGHSLVPAFLKA
jgi:integrase